MTCLRFLVLCLLTSLAASLSSCSNTRQSRSFSSSELATPANSLPHEEYPFDDGGTYVDSWAKEGSSRYRATTDTDADDRPVRRDVRTTKGDATKPKVTPPAKKPTVVSKPSKPTKATPPTKAAKTSKPTPKPTVKAKPAPPKPRSTSMTVQKGDTLFSIARRYKTTVPAIKSANGLSSDVLKDGRRLTIPLP